MKVIGIGLLVVVGIVVLMALSFGIRWFMAGPSGALEAREQILSGPSRIAAYNHFFNLCASIQGNEAQIVALKEELKLVNNDKDRSRVLANITGVTAARLSAIAQYNVDARKDYTIGQFKDLDLPYQLIGERTSTSCGNG